MNMEERHSLGTIWSNLLDTKQTSLLRGGILAALLQISQDTNVYLCQFSTPADGTQTIHSIQYSVYWFILWVFMWIAVLMLSTNISVRLSRGWYCLLKTTIITDSRLEHGLIVPPTFPFLSSTPHRGKNHNANSFFFCFFYQWKAACWLSLSHGYSFMYEQSEQHFQSGVAGVPKQERQTEILSLSAVHPPASPSHFVSRIASGNRINFIQNYENN